MDIADGKRDKNAKRQTMVIFVCFASKIQSVNRGENWKSSVTFTRRNATLALASVLSFFFR